MADEYGEKTEQPSARRINKARNEGNVIQSPDLAKGTGLVMSWLTLLIFGGWVYDNMFVSTRYIFANLHSINFTNENISVFLGQGSFFLLKLILPFFVIAATTAIVTAVFEHGWNYTLKPVMPKMSKINPVTGFSKLFKVRALVEMLKGLLKVLIVGLAIWGIMSKELTEFQFMVDMTISDIFKKIMWATTVLFARVTFILLILGIADYFVSKYLYIKDLKMTKQEVKEEYKEQEGDPKIKQKMRQVALNMAYGMTVKNTKKATVLITNPTHFAIALQYEPETMSAPKVIAKGQRRVALRMREIATENNIPIVENPPLARALYRSAAIGQEIPGNFYQAVAEVLAYVYRLQEEKRHPNNMEQPI